jgi:hypothetical protein
MQHEEIDPKLAHQKLYPMGLYNFAPRKCLGLFFQGLLSQLLLELFP